MASGRFPYQYQMFQRQSIASLGSLQCKSFSLHVRSGLFLQFSQRKKRLDIPGVGCFLHESLRSYEVPMS